MKPQMCEQACLCLTGNVDINSLEQYFRTNMAKNGWRFINSFKYNTVILNYLKDDRASHIRISRETWNNHRRDMGWSS